MKIISPRDFVLIRTLGAGNFWHEAQPEEADNAIGFFQLIVDYQLLHLGFMTIF